MSNRISAPKSPHEQDLGKLDAKEKAKRIAKVGGKVLGAAAIVGIPFLVFVGIDNSIKAEAQRQQSVMYEQLGRSGDVALGMIEANDPEAKGSVFEGSVFFPDADQDGPESVSSSVYVDSKDNTMRIMLGVNEIRPDEEGYEHRRSLWARYALPAEQIKSAFADGEVSLAELKDLVNAQTGLVDASTLQVIKDPSNDLDEVRWSNYVQPGGYRSPGAVTDGLQGLYSDVDERSQEIKNRPIGWFDKSQLEDEELKEYDAAEKAADYVKQGSPTLAEGILRQVDDAGKYKKADAQAVVDAAKKK